MRFHSWIQGVTADFREDLEKRSVLITGNRLRVKKVESGTGYVLLFGDTGTKGIPNDNIGPGLADIQPADYVVTDLGEGSTQIEITLPEQFDCTGFLSPLLWVQGLLRAPAIRIELDSLGVEPNYYWLFLFRSSNRTFRWIAEKHELMVAHDSGKVTASLTEREGGIDATISISGTGYNKGELSVERRLEDQAFAWWKKTESVPASETVGELETGQYTFEWRPRSLAVDHGALFHNTLYRHNLEFLQEFGPELADVIEQHGRELHPKVSPKYFFDGLNVKYSVRLKGKKSLTSDKDETKLDILSLDS